MSENEHDEGKLKIVDISDGEALIEAARRKGKPLGDKQKAALAAANKKKEEQKRELGVLHFTMEEKKKMPKNVKRAFRLHGVFGRPRITPDGLYQIRTRAHGFNIQVTHKDFTTCKRLYVEALERALECDEPTKTSAPVYFPEYMQKWLETVKKPAVKPVTYHDYENTFSAYIAPRFSGRKMKDISRPDLQDFINEYAEAGKNRTAQKVYQLLNPCFEYAVTDGLIRKNPMERVVLPKYEQESGRAFTKAEEREFVAKAWETPYGGALVFLLYTGLRRSELSSVIVHGGWVRLVSAKQRKGAKVAERSIPVTPMLADVLPRINISQIKLLRPDLLTKWVKRIAPTHHCHDLRHTFITRCQECGVPTPIVSLWAGHKISGIDSSLTVQVYSHYSEEAQIEEAHKVRY